ncbi:cation-translocating P-type ATPase [Mycoplasma buteonis]|uniref:cation-translocating P-type ATPase n=1 Tax=Mycoplasma buteonis TaxID=171280 RepID=UPI000568D0AF|nr:cation-translocating P-type ATPase [Mycoplasma buteonis]
MGEKQEFKSFGLTSAEAQRRLAKYGPNQLKANKKRSLAKIYFSQFKDFMIILLLIAAFISFCVAIYQTLNTGVKSSLETAVSFVEPIIILTVVALNSALGAYQEVKSDEAVKALEKTNELNAKVIRDGKLILIPSHEVVIGDLLVVEAGDAISSDARLIESYSLKVVESALTGESTPVDKEVKILKNEDIIPLAEKINQIFSGTYVVNGKAVAEVVSTGSNTEIGKINSLIQEQQVSLTPLQVKLNKLSKLFGILGIVLLVVSLVLQILLTNLFYEENWKEPQVYSDALIIAISLAVAAIPEGLITFTTVLLAIGVSRMTKENVIVKSFPAIETFGSTNVICSDKTGTLTQNKMTVVKFYDALQKEGELSTSKALSAFVACCDASVHLNENGEYEEVGDPTETGILRFGIKNNNSFEKFYETNKKIFSLPFDSDRKMMSVLVDNGAGKKFMITKGAPDVILNRSKNVTQEDVDRVNRWSEKALRVIAVAFKNLPDYKNDIDLHDEKDLTFIGLVGMIDPPRPEVKASILEAKKAGIKTVMITGDHLTTAKAIGYELGIYQQGDLVVSGEELAQMTDEELADKVEVISIYARVNPIDKLRIVKAWQSHSKVVAMTGDGVNDAPALKAADLGCAMGITGTDVSKQAADVILTDDNFSTIVKGIKDGRETFDRIKTVILNLLVSSLTEIIVMLVGLFAFRFIFNTAISKEEFFILSAAQLLWINLLTHGLPAIALGMTPLDDNVMTRMPFSKNESIFSRGMGWKLVIQSLILSFAALLSYLIVGFIAKAQGVTGSEFVHLTAFACFTTLGIGASINSLNLMSKNNIFKCNPLKYKWVYLATLSSLFLVLLVAFVPGLNSMFKMINLSSLKPENFNHGYWIVPILFGFILLGYEEIHKAWINYNLKEFFRYKK